MVVGMRHTSSATSAVIVIGDPSLATSTLNSENGSKVTITTRNTSVRATSRIVSAISFGVFWRLALSTMEIIRSRKVSPGLTETRTTIQSDSTRVPPVTDEKSPPDSRMTGADSPVIALSSTDAAPSITSPSAGMMSPVSTSTKSPLRKSSALHIACVAPRERRIIEFLGHDGLAHVAQRRGLRAAAPLGERLGEIREQHREGEPDRDRKNKTRGRLPRARQALARTAER